MYITLDMFFSAFNAINGVDIMHYSHAACSYAMWPKLAMV